MQAAKESIESELKCSLAEAEEELTHLQASVDNVEAAFSGVGAAFSSLESAVRAQQVGHMLSEGLVKGWPTG